MVSAMPQPKDAEAQLLSEKASHIAKAARAATLANVLAPLLCIPMFADELSALRFDVWLGYMLVAVLIRTWIIHQLESEASRISHPQRDLKTLNRAIGMVGAGWGLGWVLMAPGLSLVNQMIYVYMTTAAMIAGMFAYSVNKPTFLAFTLPIMVPSLVVAWGPFSLIRWPFAIGLVTLYLVVLGIAKNFAKVFEDSVRLRFRNEDLYRELEQERDQSVAANVAKSKFIATASHDLRQPLHAVNVYLELLNPDLLPASEKKSMQKIKSSVETLNGMFDALLNFSRLDAGATQVVEHPFPLEVLITTLRDLYASKANEKGLELSIHGPDVGVKGDRLLLQQIIGNLLANAIQYTEQGRIEVQFLADDRGLSIQVKDTGCGIPAAEQHIIFEQFYRANPTRNMHDGLGLGLSIVKRLCDLLGASVTLVSEPGLGSVFSVRTHFATSDRWADWDALSQVPPQALPQHGLLGKHIVLLEDNPIILEAYRQTLVSKGAHVHVLSEDEAEMSNQLETLEHIDCILSDFRLKHTTGDAVIQMLRENYNADIPAVIVTADTDPARIQFLAQLDIMVLHKPVSFLEITQAIEQVLPPA
jgi:signal transduction histidine kinase/CheY-like chemotaxis protein